MIACVRGRVVSRRAEHVVVEAAGVGYLLHVSGETLRSVPAVGQETSLHSRLVVRDDSLTLYGFSSEAELDLFGRLISVAGVGPRMALAVLSSASAADIVRAIGAGDAKLFQAAPGVGKRTAERIIVELKDKIRSMPAAASPVTNGGEGGGAGSVRLAARDGLMELGYAFDEAEALLAEAGSVEGDDEATLIERSLVAAAKARA